MIKKIAPICCMIASIVLMALPFGVRMNFASPDAAPNVSYYSYFSGMPIGYANWFPILSVVFSVVVIILLALRIKNKRPDSDFFGFGIPVYICLTICTIATPLSWLIFDTSTILSLFVFLLHIATSMLGGIFNKQSKNAKGSQ